MKDGAWSDRNRPKESSDQTRFRKEGEPGGTGSRKGWCPRGSARTRQRRAVRTAQGTPAPWTDPFPSVSNERYVRGRGVDRVGKRVSRSKRLPLPSEGFPAPVRSHGLPWKAPHRSDGHHGRVRPSTSSSASSLSFPTSALVCPGLASSSVDGGEGMERIHPTLPDHVRLETCRSSDDVDARTNLIGPRAIRSDRGCPRVCPFKQPPIEPGMVRVRSEGRKGDTGQDERTCRDIERDVRHGVVHGDHAAHQSRRNRASRGA